MLSNNFGPEETSVPAIGDAGEPGIDIGSFPYVSSLAGTHDLRLRDSDAFSKRPSLRNRTRAWLLGDRAREALSLSSVQLSTALFLLDKIRANSGARCRTCDLLGAALIISSRRTDSRKHLTIAKVVEALNRMGHRTKPRNVIRALAYFKEGGLYVGCKSPKEHLDDIFSKLNLDAPGAASRKDVAHEARLARELSLRILSVASAQKVIGNPRSMAACSMYAGFREARLRSGGIRLRVSFSKIAEASGLAEYTVRDNYERHFSGLVLH